MNQFERTLCILHEADVALVLIGGAAMTAHGSAYVTDDLDLCYESTRDNIEKLVKALAPHHPRLRGAPIDLPFHFDVSTVQRGLNFTLATDLGDIDLLGEVAGLGTYRDVLAASITLDLFGRTCQVLSLDGLIKSKRAAGRGKDLEALPELEALREMQARQMPGGRDQRS